MALGGAYEGPHGGYQDEGNSLIYKHMVLGSGSAKVQDMTFKMTLKNALLSVTKDAFCSLGDVSTDSD